MQNSFANKFSHLVLHYRWWIIVACLVTVFIAASGGRFLQFTNDYRVFFSEDNPELLAFQNMEKSYSKDDNVLIVIAPKDKNVFTRNTLDIVEKYTKAAWQIPFSIRVDSLSNFQHTYAKGDEMIVADLVKNARQLSKNQLEQIRNIALNEPQLVKRNVSEQGHVTGINVTIQLPGIDQVGEGPLVTKHARELADKIRAEHPDVDVYLTGMVMLNTAFGEVSEKDMATLMPMTFLVILISIGILLRGWTGTFTALWVIMFSIITAMGLAGWFGVMLSPPVASAPTIILTLAVANAVHVLVPFFQNMKQKLNKHDSMAESLRINLQPVFLTSLTTALGFLTMNFSDSPPFHDLGNTVAMGVMTSFILSVTFLPALMMVLPVKQPKPQSEDHTYMQKLAEFIIHNQNKLLLGMAAIFIVLVASIPKNELNDEWVSYFDKSFQFRVNTDFSTDNLTGLYRIDYSLNAKGQGGISEPAYLAKLDKFTDWYEKQPEVVHVHTLSDTIKRLNKNMHGDDPASYRLPENRNLSAQYLLLYEMSLPYGLDLNNQINVNKSATRLTVTTETISVKQILGLEQRAQSWLANNAPEIKSDGTGTSIMFAHIGQRNIKSMLLGTSLALIIISFILLIAFKSAKIGAISLIPNLIPGAMGFGLWGILVGQVGMGLAVVAGLTLGIVVDDTVHFLSKYLRGRREKGLNPEDAVRYAFSTVGTALVFTSITLVAGFMVLAMSTFKMNAHMGMLTSITIIFALVADFLFLPPLLMKLDRETESENESDDDAIIEPASA
ncbi:MAG: MMPL family transporter [Gammaproteobacteria bacterium]|nr:MMPL family transporter [Gammaproteobacteria bacterium]